LRDRAKSRKIAGVTQGETATEPTRRLNRRSFLRQVAGGAAGAGALAAIGGEARAVQTGPYTGVTDTDSGVARDPANYGRGGRACRDSDASRPHWQERDPVRRCQ
jgi:hypothetical protein